MTATEEPRRLLNELRKLACDINEKEIRSHSVITLNQGRYNRQFRLDMNHDWLNAWHAELERILQAIEATLGPCNCTNDCTNSERTGTCHDEGTFHSWGYFTCSNCYVVVPVEAVREAPSIGKVVPISYCPNCRAKVVSE